MASLASGAGKSGTSQKPASWESIVQESVAQSTPRAAQSARQEKAVTPERECGGDDLTRLRGTASRLEVGFWRGAPFGNVHKFDH